MVWGLTFLLFFSFLFFSFDDREEKGPLLLSDLSYVSDTRNPHFDYFDGNTRPPASPINTASNGAERATKRGKGWGEGREV
jgi:hypothetical protein